MKGQGAASREDDLHRGGGGGGPPNQSASSSSSSSGGGSISNSSSSSSPSAPAPHHHPHPSTPKLLLLVAGWWSFSAWNAVSAKLVLRAPDGNACVAVVSAASNLMGVFLVGLYYAIGRNINGSKLAGGRGGAQAAGRGGPPWAAMGRELRSVPWSLSTSHAVGLYAAYRGLVGAKVSVVQAVKALEPLIAMTMSATCFRHLSPARPDCRSVLSALVAVAGVVVVCVEDTTYSAGALLWVLCSSFVTQGRNQMMKAQQVRQEAGAAAKSRDADGTRGGGDVVDAALLRPAANDEDGGAMVVTGSEEESSEGRFLSPKRDFEKGGGGDDHHRMTTTRPEKFDDNDLTGNSSSSKGGGTVPSSSSSVAAGKPSSSEPSTSSSELSLSPALRGCLIFVATSAGAFFVNVLMVVVEVALLSSSRGSGGGKGGSNAEADAAVSAVMCRPIPVLTAGLTHFLYNLASFGVLALVVPATHSLANTTKRAVIVGTSAVVLKDGLSRKAILGMGLVVGGSGYYGYAAKSAKKGRQQTTTTTTTAARQNKPQQQRSSRRRVLLLLLLYLSVLTPPLLGIFLLKNSLRTSGKGRTEAKTQLQLSTTPQAFVPGPNVHLRAAGGAGGTLNAPRTAETLCNYTGRRVALFTDAGNGNWGDNMQPWTWANLFRDKGIPLSALSSTSCDTCTHAYPWIDEATRHRMPKANVTDSAAFVDADVLWFGGGGLFGYPHRPLSHDEGGWQEWAVEVRGIVPVFAAVGSTGTEGGRDLIRQARKLVDGAAYVSGRGSIEVDAFRDATGRADVPVMPDPILSDHVTYPMQIHSDPLADRPLCWIFRSEDETFLSKVARFVNEGDIIYALDGKDGDYHGLFRHAVVKSLNQGTDFFGSVASGCKMLISQRYHGVIMALRSSIPVVGLYEYHPHEVSDVMDLAGESDCAVHVSNFTESGVAFDLIKACFANFDPDKRDGRLAGIQAMFQEQFDAALKAAGVCS